MSQIHASMTDQPKRRVDDAAEAPATAQVATLLIERTGPNEMTTIVGGGAQWAR